MLGKVKRPLSVAIVATAALGAGIVLLLSGPDDPPPLRRDTSGFEESLPGGFSLAEGSVLLGPPVVEAVDATGKPLAWFAVMAVTGDPIEVWNHYLRQAELVLDTGLPPGTGCGIDLSSGFHCEWSDVGAGSGTRVLAAAALDSVPGDVTGRYLLTFEIAPTDLPYDGLAPSPAIGPTRARSPEAARRLPRPGDPLAPETVAYRGDEARYVLLEGSELIAQWGPGSLTGGFEVLLRVAPDAAFQEVVDAYVAQAAQFEGPTEERRLVVRNTVITIYSPPGGAGGYAARIRAVDQPGRTGDYIYYSLLND